VHERLVVGEAALGDFGIALAAGEAGPSLGTPLCAVITVPSPTVK